MSEERGRGLLEGRPNRGSDHSFAGLIRGVLTRLRAIVGTPLGVLLTAFFSVLVTALALLGFQRATDASVRAWASALLALFGIRVIGLGTRNLPEHGGGIIVFNHQSHFDIPAIMKSTEKRIRFGAKIELFKIPFFGTAMRAIGTLPIARRQKEQVFRVYQEAQARFKENMIFVLAPEGTRQPEKRIGVFKKGPFAFAVSGQVPLIPVVIKGAHSVLPKGGVLANVDRWRRSIHVQYLPAVDTKGMTMKALDELTESVRKAMIEAYEALPEDQ